MIVYNITIKILPAIEKEWIEWQKTEHIPAIMASGHFTGYRFYRLLDQDTSDGITYVLQYFAVSLAAFEQYIQVNAPQLRKEALQRWGDQFIAFRTVMEEIQ
jgi:hypothetical protein